MGGLGRRGHVLAISMVSVAVMDCSAVLTAGVDVDLGRVSEACPRGRHRDS